MRWKWKSIHKHVSRVTKAAPWKKVRLKTAPISSGKQHGRLSPTQNSGCHRTTPLAHTNLETRTWIHTNRVFQVFLRPKTKITNNKQTNKNKQIKQTNKNNKTCPVPVISVMLGKSIMGWLYWDASTNLDIWNPQKNHCGEIESKLTNQPRKETTTVGLST